MIVIGMHSIQIVLGVSPVATTCSGSRTPPSMLRKAKGALEGECRACGEWREVSFVNGLGRAIAGAR
jgi:hypothetical protein